MPALVSVAGDTLRVGLANNRAGIGPHALWTVEGQVLPEGHTVHLPDGDHQGCYDRADDEPGQAEDRKPPSVPSSAISSCRRVPFPTSCVPFIPLIRVSRVPFMSSI